MSYVRKHWENWETKLNANNLNNIEDGIEEALRGVNGLSEQLTIDLERIRNEFAEDFTQIREEMSEADQGLSREITLVDEKITLLRDNLNNLMKIDSNGNTWINKGMGFTYTLAEEYDENETYYESYIKITPSVLTGTWVVKDETVAPVGSLNVTYTDDMAILPYMNEDYLHYFGSVSGGRATYYHYNNEGEKVSDGSYPIWLGSAWNACWAMSFSGEDANTLAWVQANHNKVSDNYATEELLSVEDIEAYDRLHPSYREKELTPSEFVPNTYYTRTEEPIWVRVKDLGGGADITELEIAINQAQIDILEIQGQLGRINQEINSIKLVNSTLTSQVNVLNDLIKTDNEGNVFVNIGYEFVYTLASEYDSSKTYYEAYVQITPSVLTGTWLQKQTTKPSNMYSFNKSFTEGVVIASGTWHPRTDSKFNEYVLSINSSGNVYYKRFGSSDSQYGPMFIGNDWNCAGDLSFKSEVDAETLAFVQRFYDKKTDRYVDESGNCTIDQLVALDIENPSYRVIALTEQTFIPNTYYTLTKQPNWVNLKTFVRH